MDGLLIIAGVLALLTSVIHIFAGGRDVAEPLLDTSLPNDAKYALHACWHFVSIFFVVTALYLLSSGLGVVEQGPGLIILISGLWLLFGLLFLGITVRVNGPGGVFKLPQWVLLLPVGVLGLLAVLA